MRRQVLRPARRQNIGKFRRQANLPFGASQADIRHIDFVVVRRVFFVIEPRKIFRHIGMQINAVVFLPFGGMNRRKNYARRVAAVALFFGDFAEFEDHARKIRRIFLNDFDHALHLKIFRIFRVSFQFVKVFKAANQRIANILRPRIRQPIDIERSQQQRIEVAFEPKRNLARTQFHRVFKQRDIRPTERGDRFRG